MVYFLFWAFQEHGGLPGVESCHMHSTIEHEDINLRIRSMNNAQTYHFIILVLFRTETEIQQPSLSFPSLPRFVSHTASCSTETLQRSSLHK